MIGVYLLYKRKISRFEIILIGVDIVMMVEEILLGIEVKGERRWI